MNKLSLYELYLIVINKYQYNDQAYPALEYVTDSGDRIAFAIRHSLEHLCKRFRYLGYRQIYEQSHAHTMRFVVNVDPVDLGNDGNEFKKALLGSIASALSLCNAAGVTKEWAETATQPNEQEITDMVRVPYLQAPRTASYKECVEYFIQEFSSELEKMGHAKPSMKDFTRTLALGQELYLCTRYWFGDDWSVDLLIAVAESL